MWWSRPKVKKGKKVKKAMEELLKAVNEKANKLGSSINQEKTKY